MCNFGMDLKTETAAEKLSWRVVTVGVFPSGFNLLPDEDAAVQVRVCAYRALEVSMNKA
jgi:hypothetical protein